MDRQHDPERRRCLRHLRQSQLRSVGRAWRSVRTPSAASDAAHFHHRHPDHVHEEHARCHIHLAYLLATAAGLPSVCGVGSVDPAVSRPRPIAVVVGSCACRRRLPSSVISFQIAESGSDTTRAELDPHFAGVAT